MKNERKGKDAMIISIECNANECVFGQMDDIISNAEIAECESETEENSKKPPAFMLYADMKPLFMSLSNEQAGRVIKMAFEYFENGELLHSDDALVELGFNLVKPKIDQCFDKYTAICKRNKANRNKHKTEKE